MKGQVLSPPDKQKRIVRARNLLKQLTVNKLNRTSFSDEKVFKVQDSQNCRVYALCDQKKRVISDSRPYSCRTGFPKFVILSIGVSKVGKTSVVLLRKEQRLIKSITVVMLLRL